MNKERRALVDKAITIISEAQNIIEGVKNDEQEIYDNMTEDQQNADPGTKLASIIESLEEADFDTMISSLADARDA